MPRSVVLVVTLLGACSQRPAARIEVPTRPVSSEPVLATVNSAPILASDLAVQTRGGRTPRQALTELIQQELLVQEAARRSLDHHPSVLDAQRRAMVELLIRRTFRDQLGPKQIPARLVEQAYRKNLGHFKHGELVEVNHILVKAGQKQPPADREASRRLAERVHALATARPLTPQEFLELGKQLGQGRSLVEQLSPRPYEWFLKEVADAARALPRPGEVSGVIESRIGYHVIYLVRRVPAIDIPLQQAEAEVRERILEEARSILLRDLIDKLERERQVKLMPENLPGLAAEAQP